MKSNKATIKIHIAYVFGLCGIISTYASEGVTWQPCIEPVQNAIKTTLSSYKINLPKVGFGVTDDMGYAKTPTKEKKIYASYVISAIDGGDYIVLSRLVHDALADQTSQSRSMEVWLKVIILHEAYHILLGHRLEEPGKFIKSIKYEEFQANCRAFEHLSILDLDEYISACKNSPNTDQPSIFTQIQETHQTLPEQIRTCKNILSRKIRAALRT